MTTLTSRERLLRVLRGGELDRAPVRLWGVDPLAPAQRPEWQPLHDMVKDYGLDTFFSFGGEFPPFPVEMREETWDTADPDWYETKTTYLTPAGPLSRVFHASRSGKPGYLKKYLIETVEDARRWLSIPAQGVPDARRFADRVAQVGDLGLVMTGLDHAMYYVNDAMGSELWGLWMYDERELVHEMVAKASKEVFAIAKAYIEQGCGPLFGWVGPELCIPPLASPHDFDDFVTRYDKPLIDLIHNAGGLVWVHCHGDMHPVLERFADLGVDCLNPIEPPPMGKLTLADAKRRVGARMTLEGGFEIGDLELEGPEAIAATVAGLLEMGKPDGRYILCPSSDHSHWPGISQRILDNYRVFVETGLRLGRY
ncbi:MAG: uroporphyrinogen decarboxylase family protein [Armatimonadota bacterium]